MYARLPIAVSALSFAILGIASVTTASPPRPIPSPVPGLESPSQTQIASVEIREAARRLQRRTGRVSVVLFFSTGCSLSQRLFPSFVAMAKEYQRRGVDFLVFSTDLEGNFRRIAPFLAEHGATFETVYVKPWQSGQFKSALAPLGIEIGDTWTRPLVAVRDRNGRVLLQGQGVVNLAPFQAAVDDAIGSDGGP
ncbi:TlpA family protein disulfide reductase [Gemmatimonadota bacterium]